MQNNIRDLTEAIDKSADTSFDAADTPTRRPAHNEQRSGRDPTREEKRGAWQLHEEYLACRLGKNEEENSRLWNTALWIDRHNRIVTMPAEAVKGLNLYADGGWEDVADHRDDDPEDGPVDKDDGFGFEKVNIDERDKERLMLKLSDYDLVRLMDDLNDCDKVAKIDSDDLMRKARPLPQIDFPNSDQRVESGEIIRILKVVMHSLWHPVIRAIDDHLPMKPLGASQGVGDSVAAAVGRQRVIEGLRFAESTRKGLKKSAQGRPLKQDRDFSLWLDKIHARQEQVPPVEWRRSGRYKLGSVDEIIGGTLAALPMPVRAPEGHYLNQAAGPVIKLADNGICRVEALAGRAA